MSEKKSVPVNRQLLWITAGICVLLALAEFFYAHKSYFALQDLKGFYALFGVATLTGAFLIARIGQMLLSRPQDYYAPKDVQSEDYPSENEEEVSHG